MATPKTFTDNSTDVDEANLNLFLRAGKLQVKINYFVFKFQASDNTVTIVGTFDSDGEVVDADLVWNAGATRVDITVSGFTTKPIPLATIVDNASTDVAEIEATASSSSLAIVKFKVAGVGPADIDPNGDMQVAVLLIGL